MKARLAALFLSCFLTSQIKFIASKRFEMVGRNKIPNKTPFSTTDVKFEQHCFSKCHYITKCASFLIETISNVYPIKCSFYNTTTTKISSDFQTSDGLKLFTDIRDCQDVYDRGSKASGFYSVNLNGRGERQVFCDMELQGVYGWLSHIA